MIDIFSDLKDDTKWFRNVDNNADTLKDFKLLCDEYYSEKIDGNLIYEYLFEYIEKWFDEEEIKTTYKEINNYVYHIMIEHETKIKNNTKKYE